MSSVDQMDYFQERQQTLQLIDHRISLLEQQLVVERQARECVLQDIDTFRPSQLTDSRLPLDILPNIFMKWDGDPYLRNHTLSLVCKAWYHVIWNTSIFWTEVILRPDHRMARNDSICRFAGLCHQRSNNKPLNVTVDFSAMLPYAVYIGQILDERPDAFRFLPLNIPPEFARRAELGLMELFSGRHYDHQEYYQDIPQCFIKKSMGPNRNLCRRWKSLKVILPRWVMDRDAAKEILKAMVGNMENLVGLDMQGRIANGSVLFGTDDPVPHFPNLTRLATNFNIDFNNISLDYAVLEHLSLHDQIPASTFQHIALDKFSALVTLELLLPKRHNTTFDPPEISLPKLQSLMLLGPGACVQQYVHVIHAPVLQRLHIKQHPFSPFKATVSSIHHNITSLLIDVEASAAGQYGNSFPLSCEELKVVLRQTSLLSSLRIKPDEWGGPECVSSAVQEVKEEQGQRLQHLEKVIMVYPGGGFLTTDENQVSILRMM